MKIENLEKILENLNALEEYIDTLSLLPVILESLEKLEESLNAEGAFSYKIVENNEIIAGVIVNINTETNHNHLDILFTKVGIQSKGIGMFIWNEIEKLYSDTEVWETVTPYFDKRNIH